MIEKLILPSSGSSPQSIMVFPFISFITAVSFVDAYSDDIGLFKIL